MDKILEKLKLTVDNPGIYKPLTPEESAELFLYFLQPKPKLFKKPKVIQGIDGVTPEPDKDYISKETALKFLADVKSELEAKNTELEKAIQSKLATVKNGEDAEITDDIIATIASVASSLVELPDFDILITESSEAIRNALELLVDDERLDISAIKGLEKRDQTISDELTNRAIGIVDQRTSFLINKVSNVSNELTTLGSEVDTLADQWQRITRNGVPLIEPVNSTDVLHLGTMTNFAPYSSVSGAKAWFTTQGEASFFTTITNGDPVLFFNAYGNMFTGFRGRGTIDSPTAVVAGDGLLTLLAASFDSNNTLTLTSSGRLLFAALQVRAGTPSAGDVPQEIHIGTGLVDNGTIRVTSANELAFYKQAAIARPATGGVASTFVANTSGIVNDTATFDGYTIGQVVKALRNLGLLT